MISSLRLFAKLLIPTRFSRSWQKALLDVTYAKSISSTRKLKYKEKIEQLEHEYRYQTNLFYEEDDVDLTKTLLFKARNLRVPIPRLYKEDKTESEFWNEGQYTGIWILTTCGFAKLREEIRLEAKARHEGQAQWVVWLSAVTGVLGAATGLLALLLH
jgi:hypothetical protein